MRERNWINWVLYVPGVLAWLVVLIMLVTGIRSTPYDAYGRLRPPPHLMVNP
jgi:hypothetical protein